MSHLKSWAAIVICGKIPPEEISRLLNLPADFSHLIEKPNEGSLWHWQYNSRLRDEDPLSIHLLDLLKKIAPKRKEFQEISKQTESTFYCSVEINSLEDSEGIVFDPKLLSLLANLGVKLEIHRWLDHDSRRIIPSN